MKRYIHAFPAFAVVAGGLIYSVTSLAGIANTKHNLSPYSSIAPKEDLVYVTDQQEICAFCHTPHMATRAATPLWHGELNQENFPTYTSMIFGSEDETDIEMSLADEAVVSNLCLSCHDGTIAINAFNSPTGALSDPYSEGTAYPLGSVTELSAYGGLQDDHPINFMYNARGAGGYQTNPRILPASNHARVKLYDGKVQCASCHDPHIDEREAFLRVTMSGSALCVECHDK